MLGAIVMVVGGVEIAERGGGSRDGPFRPLALGFHAQVSPQLLKGHLDLPPQQIPLQYPQGFRRGVGA